MIRRPPRSTLFPTRRSSDLLRIGRLEELDSGLLSLAEFVSHAAAVIEDDSDGDRNVFGREVHDLLLDVVFKDSEIISVEARDQPAIRDGYRDVDKGQFDVDAERFAILH